MTNDLMVRDEDIVVSASPHPFKIANEITIIAEGKTLSEILDQVQPDEILRSQVSIFLNDELIPRQMWETILPQPKDFVFISVVPGKGRSKNIVQSVVAIATIAAAIALPPLISAAIPFGSLNTFGIIAVKAIVGGVGMLAKNALAPPTRAGSPNLPSLSGTGGSTSPTLTIEGARNSSNQFGVVPVILGVHKHVPPLGAFSYTELVGNDQHFKMLVVWGYGRLKIEDIKIGTTAVTDFEDVVIETREGVSGDAAISIFPDQVTETSFSIALDVQDEWHIRTTEIETDEISVDILYARGLISYDTKGSRETAIGPHRIEYRAVGDITWLTPSFTATNVPSSWISGSQISFTAASPDALRYGFRWAVTSGQYEVRIKRDSGVFVSSTGDQNEATWSILRSIKNADPINFPHPLAITALSIKATNRLNGAIDQLNATVSSYVQEYDGVSTWSEAVSSNPASLFRHVLQSPANIGAVADARIDLDSLETFHTYCVTNGFEFNMIRDFKASVWETLSDIAGVARAVPADIDGKWSVVIDQEQAIPTQHFTSRNSSNFEAEKDFITSPHGFKMKFPNRDKEWKQDELIVYDDTYTSSNATDFEQLDGIGITDKDHLWKYGRFHLAGIRLRPETYKFSVDFEYLIAKKGDLILISHDVLLVGLAAGRITAIQTDSAGDVTGITVDEVFTMEAAKSYGISIRTIGDVEIVRTIVLDVGDQTTITFDSVIASANAPVVQDLVSFGISGSESIEALITSVEARDELSAGITAIPNSANGMYSADTGTIPEFVSKLTAVATLPDVVVETVRTDESVLVLGSGNTLISRIGISVVPVLNRLEAHLEAGIRVTSTDGPFLPAKVESLTNNEIIIGEVQEGETYDIRLQWVSPKFLVNGDFSFANGTLVIGQTSAPSPLSELNISIFGGSVILRWDMPTEFDVRFGGTVEFRHSHETSSASASWSASVSIGTSSQGSDLIAVLPLKAGTYLARVFDKGGRGSTIVGVDTKQAALLDFAVADNITEETTFAGTHTNTIAIDGVLKLVGSDNMDSWTDVDSVANWDSEGGIVSSGTYDFALGHDLSSVKKTRVTTDINMTVQNVLDQIDSRSDNVDTWESWDGDTSGEGDARAQVRVTDDDPALSAASYSAWNNLDSAEYTNRGFDYRLLLTSNNTSFNAIVSKLQVNLEEPS